MVYTTAPATLNAQITNASGWTVDSMTITVDDTNTIPAMVQSSGNGIFQGTVPWNDTSGNPSEHTVYAQATIHNYYGQSMTLDSRTTATGAGRAADFMVADIRLKSLAFTGNIALADDGATPIASPEFTWDPASGIPTSANPVAYVQGKSVGFTMALCTSKGYDLSGMSINGGATMGYTLQLVADPFTTNPATGQPDPPLTLYDNTTASPVAPTPFTDTSTIVSATTPLDGWVSQYDLDCSVLNLYVKFAYMKPTPVWRLVGSYAPPNSGFSTTLYAVVAAPSQTGPMPKPWVGVLSYASDWAERTSDGTGAATAVCNGFYDSALYSPNHVWYTDATTPETFHLLNFLNRSLGTTTPELQGQCNDFSDFLVCLSASLGAKSLQSQQSNGGFNYSHVIYAGSSAAHTPMPDYFYYHQWTTDGSAASGNVFDSAVRPDSGSVTIPVNEALSPYLTWLAPGTSLTAQDPFPPHVTN